MKTRRWQWHSRRWWIGAFLLAMALRAYVPAGFMPGSSLLSLEICPEGLASAMHLHHAGHMAGHDAHEHFAHCPFGSVSADGPISHAGAEFTADCASIAADVFFLSQPRASRLERSHAPRAPPLLV
jgi:hypothetical protein